MTGPSVWGWQPEARGPPAAGAALVHRRHLRNVPVREQEGAILVSVKNGPSQPTHVPSGKLETGSWGRMHPAAGGGTRVQSPWWGS